MILKIIRFNYSPEGTFGWAEANELEEDIWTVEAPWKENLPYHSCVPAGFYNLIDYSSSNYPDTFELKNDDLLSSGEADGRIRSSCVLHPGNWGRNFKGCVGFGTGRNQEMVTNSKEGTSTILELLKEDDDNYCLIENFEPWKQSYYHDESDMEPEE